MPARKINAKKAPETAAAYAQENATAMQKADEALASRLYATSPIERELVRELV